MTIQTGFLTEAELQDAWPEAVAVVVATGDDQTPHDKLLSAAVELARTHDEWGKAWIKGGVMEHAGERWATVSLLVSPIVEGMRL